MKKEFGLQDRRVVAAPLSPKAVKACTRRKATLATQGALAALVARAALATRASLATLATGTLTTTENQKRATKRATPQTYWCCGCLGGEESWDVVCVYRATNTPLATPNPLSRSYIFEFVSRCLVRVEVGNWIVFISGPEILHPSAIVCRIVYAPSRRTSSISPG